mmetsp:Transcript_45971/g.130402  ORF Transcript_45971/g.130402 Transcript_45971/m.130402 type:complete len:774 (+) Transcript_45971:100-2421(+)
MNVKDRYRVVPPGGGQPLELIIDVGASVAEAYADVAELLELGADQISLLLRNPPGSALPMFHLRLADDVTLRSSAPPGSVLVAELAAGASGGDGTLGQAPDWLREASGQPRAAAADAADANVDAEEAGAAVATEATASPLPVPPAKRPATDAKERSADAVGLTGLYNLGNTCYLASAVQCLSQTSALSAQLRSSGSAGGKSDASGGGASGAEGSGRVAQACGDLLRSLWSPSGSEAVGPCDLKASVSERAKLFEGYGQQDAQELMQVLLESLHEDLRRPRPSEPKEMQLPSEEGARASELWRRAQEQDSSLVSDIFQGQLRSAVCCAGCGHEEVGFELFWSLPLPLPPRKEDGGESSLEDALDAFCADEPLDSSWKCGRCAGPSQGSKRARLWRAPPVLQLHLKRFSWKMDGAAETTPATASTARAAGGDEQPKSGTAPIGTAAAAEVPSGASGTGGYPAANLSGGRAPRAPSADEPAAASAAATSPAAAPVELEAVSEEAEAAADEVEISVECAPEGIAASLPFEDQARMYELLGHFLLNITNDPEAEKFRSFGKSNAKIRKDILDLRGGPELVQWAGFRDTGDRFEAHHLTSDEVNAKYAELASHARLERNKHLRRLDRERIEREYLKRLPRGDDTPLRRWGGMLPSFGRGSGFFGGMMQCSKVETRVVVAADASRPRGFAPVLLRNCFADGSPDKGSFVQYELYAVVQHLGPTPFSGHYVATCWHGPSGAWWKFNDSVVTRLSTASLVDEVLTGGAYVLFLERTTGDAAS